MSKYVIGIDYGTNSCRSLLTDLADGRELASSVFAYPSGTAGVILSDTDPNLARQNAADYVLGIEETIRNVLAEAKKSDARFNPRDVIAIGVDTTGSSPMPVDAQGQALSESPRFRGNPHAMVWLWKDHSSYAEAALITETARKIRPQYLSPIGGIYSSEWFWSKILHCKNIAPDVFAATNSFVEICDWITGVLTGQMNPQTMRRSICAAGHKAMYNTRWGGLPDTEFLEALSPGLGALRSHLYSSVYTSEQAAGTLSPAWAAKLGLSTEVVIAVGSFDAHMGAVGAGIEPGTLVKIMGTSTCDIMVWPHDKPLKDIPGVCGIVDGSVMEGYYGIEAGQSAVGDIFGWFVQTLVPEKYGATTDDKFSRLEADAAALRPGESGLLALDWNNGNRTILVDVRLTGLLLGQTLHTQPHEIYRALLEATAFGALAIIDRIEEYGVSVNTVINCGGLAAKSPLLMQIYADICGRPMQISRSSQTPSLGAGLLASVAAGTARGGYASVGEAKRAMTGTSRTYAPQPSAVSVYRSLYKLYRQLHEGFGTPSWNGNMANVMKDLLTIRDEARRHA